MPVSVAITIADPPAAPAGYTLVAFEVRSVQHSGGLEPVAAFAGTTEGFEDAANILVKAVEASLRTAGVGLRIAAVSWWVDQPLEKCVNGHERLVSVYDAGNRRWQKWEPEERIGEPASASVSRGHRTKAQGQGWRRTGGG